jgi:hypothetical protein
MTKLLIFLLALLVNTELQAARDQELYLLNSNGGEIVVQKEASSTRGNFLTVTYRGKRILREEISTTLQPVSGFYASTDFGDIPTDIKYLLLNSYQGDGCPLKYTLIRFSITKHEIFRDLGNCDPVEQIEVGRHGLRLKFMKNPILSDRRSLAYTF